MPTLISRQIIATVCTSALLILSIYGCRNEYESNSYISQYSIIVGIEITGSYTPKTENNLLLSFRLATKNHVSIASKDEDKQLYNQIRTINGDTTFFGKVKKNGAFISGGHALYPNVSAINLTCSIDFDEKHPAGTSLNDCFELEYSHFERFNDKGIVKKRTKMSDIEKIKCIVSDKCDIYYCNPPATRQMTTITLTITMDNGDVYEDKYPGMI